MRIIKQIALFMFVLTISCKNNNNEEEVYAMNRPSREITEIRYDVFSGKISAYNELKDLYVESDPADFLYYAMFMANKYKYPPAYLDVYKCFDDDYSGFSFEERDEETQKIMLKYLNYAVKKNVNGSKEELEELHNSKKK